MDNILSDPARWHLHTLDAWREIRFLRDMLRTALALLVEQRIEIEKISECRDDFRAQVRALMTGRTIVAERQSLVRERLDEELEAIQGERADRHQHDGVFA